MFRLSLVDLLGIRVLWMLIVLRRLILRLLCMLRVVLFVMSMIFVLNR